MGQSHSSFHLRPEIGSPFQECDVVINAYMADNVCGDGVGFEASETDQLSKNATCCECISVTGSKVTHVPGLSRNLHCPMSAMSSLLSSKTR